MDLNLSMEKTPHQNRQSNRHGDGPELRCLVIAGRCAGLECSGGGAGNQRLNADVGGGSNAARTGKGRLRPAVVSRGANDRHSEQSRP
jgi:hypothetical protein